MNKFKQVVNYIASYDPEFPKHIKGATQAQIDELNALQKPNYYNHQIPESVHLFLDIMGTNQDWLVIKDIQGVTYDFDINKLIEFYKEHSWIPPSQLFCLAIGPNGQNLFLNLSFSTPGDDTLIEGNIDSVAYSTKERRADDYCDTAKFVASSLLELICLTVFERYEILAKNRQHRAYVISHIWEKECDFLGGLEEKLLKDGFKKLWFSGLSKAYLRDDVALKIVTDKGIRYTYWLSADSEELLEHYDELIDQYRLNFKGPLNEYNR